MGKSKKLLAHYEQVKTIIGLYIVLFFAVPALSLMISYVVCSAEIEAGEQGALETALQVGLKWYAILMPIITVLFLVWFLYYSGKVEFADASLNYYPYIFSKTPRIIHYNEVTECVLVGRLWNSKRRVRRIREIMLYSQGNVIITFDISSRLALMLVLFLGEDKVKIVSDRGNLVTLSKFYDIKFTELNNAEQLKILNYYCKLNYPRYKTGKEILHRETE